MALLVNLLKKFSDWITKQSMIFVCCIQDSQWKQSRLKVEKGKTIYIKANKKKTMVVFTIWDKVEFMPKSIILRLDSEHLTLWISIYEITMY